MESAKKFNIHWPEAQKMLSVLLDLAAIEKSKITHTETRSKLEKAFNDLENYGKTHWSNELNKLLNFIEKTRLNSKNFHQNDKDMVKEQLSTNKELEKEFAFYILLHALEITQPDKTLAVTDVPILMTLLNYFPEGDTKKRQSHFSTLIQNIVGETKASQVHIVKNEEIVDALFKAKRYLIDNTSKLRQEFEDENKLEADREAYRKKLQFDESKKFERKGALKEENESLSTASDESPKDKESSDLSSLEIVDKSPLKKSKIITEYSKEPSEEESQRFYKPGQSGFFAKFAKDTKPNIPKTSGITPKKKS